MSGNLFHHTLFSTVFIFHFLALESICLRNHKKCIVVNIKALYALTRYNINAKISSKFSIDFE